MPCGRPAGPSTRASGFPPNPQGNVNILTTGDKVVRGKLPQASAIMRGQVVDNARGGNFRGPKCPEGGFRTHPGPFRGLSATGRSCADASTPPDNLLNGIQEVPVSRGLLIPRYFSPHQMDRFAKLPEPSGCGEGHPKRVEQALERELINGCPSMGYSRIGRSQCSRYRDTGIHYFSLRIHQRGYARRNEAKPRLGRTTALISGTPAKPNWASRRDSVCCGPQSRKRASATSTLRPVALC